MALARSSKDLKWTGRGAGHRAGAVSSGRRIVLPCADRPRSGSPLEIGRTSYRVPKAMRQWLRLRDGQCPFRGCNNHSLDNETDHLLAWADGAITASLAWASHVPAAPRLRHATAWRAVDATRERPPCWISPAGRSYPSEQQDWKPPHWPQRLGTLVKAGSWNRPTGRTYLLALSEPKRPGSHYPWIPFLTGHCSSRRRSGAQLAVRETASLPSSRPASTTVRRRRRPPWGAPMLCKYRTETAGRVAKLRH